MLKTSLRRALLAVSACFLASGCSGNPASVALNQSPAVVPQRATGIVPRFAVGQVKGHGSRASVLPHAWPHQNQILFVGDQSDGNQVLMYNPKNANSPAEASITTGVSFPQGLAIDNLGALYVANLGNNTVTVYGKGKTSPRLTIGTGINSPYGITVDSKGNIFVSNRNSDNVTAYKSGATSPYATIDFNGLGLPAGVASDANDNIWVACNDTNTVYKIPAGSTTPMNAGLSGLGTPVGISFGKYDKIYVSNLSLGNVTVYKYGTTSVKTTITTGIETYGPVLNAVTASGAFFQINESLNVVGYLRGQTSPFSTLTGTPDPEGIAAYPLVKK